MTVTELRKALKGLDGKMEVTFYTRCNIRPMQFEFGDSDARIVSAEEILQSDGSSRFTFEINDGRRW